MSKKNTHAIGIPCPQCGKATTVIDHYEKGPTIRRRRKCPDNHRFSTVEYIEAIDDIPTKSQP